MVLELNCSPSKETKTICSFLGTQKLHAIRPMNDGIMEVKEYSCSTISRNESVTVVERETPSIPMTALKGYCIAAYDNDWYLACITRTDADANEVCLNFLEPRGPAHSFVFPSKPDELVVDVTDILCVVSPTTYTGRTYVLKCADMAKATGLLKKRSS